MRYFIAGESYTSHVTTIEPHVVTAVCTDMHLFEHLKSVWTIADANLEGKRQTCKVDFAVSFQFKQRVHAFFAKMFFDDVVKQNVSAFLKEAERRYGPECIPRQEPIVFSKISWLKLNVSKSENTVIKILRDLK